MGCAGGVWDVHGEEDGTLERRYRFLQAAAMPFDDAAVWRIRLSGLAMIGCIVQLVECIVFNGLTDKIQR